MEIAFGIIFFFGYGCLSLASLTQEEFYLTMNKNNETKIPNRFLSMMKYSYLILGLLILNIISFIFTLSGILDSYTASYHITIILSITAGLFIIFFIKDLMTADLKNRYIYYLQNCVKQEIEVRWLFDIEISNIKRKKEDPIDFFYIRKLNKRHCVYYFDSSRKILYFWKPKYKINPDELKNYIDQLNLYDKYIEDAKIYSFYNQESLQIFYRLYVTKKYDEYTNTTKMLIKCSKVFDIISLINPYFMMLVSIYSIASIWL